MVGTGRGGRLGIFHNAQGKGFQILKEEVLMKPAARDQTTILAEERFIFVGTSNYEDGRTNGGYARLIDLGAARSGEILSGPKAATGPMAMADIDGDGFLDLFIGTTCVAGRYPESGESLVCIREGPVFRISQKISAGLVSGAVFSDIDMDGDPDLLLACQWGPVRVYLN